MINLLPVPVLLAIFGAATTLVVPAGQVQRLISVACLSGIVIVAGLFMYATSTTGPMALWLGGWAAPLGHRAGRRPAERPGCCWSPRPSRSPSSSSPPGRTRTRSAARPLCRSSTRRSCCWWPACRTPSSRATLFNLFVGFEILLFASYVLLTLGGTADRVRAGTTYVIVSLLSSSPSLFLISISAIYAATGTVNMAHLFGAAA